MPTALESHRPALSSLLAIAELNASAEGATERERQQWGAAADVLRQVLGGAVIAASESGGPPPPPPALKTGP